MNRIRRCRADSSFCLLVSVSLSTWIIGLACTGCLHTAALVTKPTRATAPSIQSTPEYRQAALQFDHHKFKESLATIETLLTRPNLSQSDLALLERQQEICKDALSTSRKLVAKSTPAAKTTTDKNDCGPKALSFVLERLGVKANPASLGQIAGTTQFGTTMEGLTKAAELAGVKAEGIQMDRNAILNLESPAVAWVDGDHYIAVLKVNGDSARIHDPDSAKEEAIETDALLRRSGGVMLKVVR